MHGNPMKTGELGQGIAVRLVLLMAAPLHLALRICRWVALVMISLMCIVALVQVLSRVLPGIEPFSWTEEASLFLMVYMTFAVLPIASYRNLHTLLDMFLDRMGKLKFPMQVLINLLCLITSLACVYYGFIFYNSGSGTMATTLPWLDRGWVYLAIPISFGLMAVVYVQNTLVLFIRRSLDKRGDGGQVRLFDAAIHVQHL
jgi:TRAP-type C4-dicarboxylate transport system permease small subunit